MSGIKYYSKLFQVQEIRRTSKKGQFEIDVVLCPVLQHRRSIDPLITLQYIDRFDGVEDKMLHLYSNANTDFFEALQPGELLELSLQKRGTA